MGSVTPRVLVASGQRLFGQALAIGLAQVPDMETEVFAPGEELMSGVDAVAAVARASPDVAVIDYWMSEMQAPAAVRAILNWVPDVKVLVLGAILGATQIQAALDAGAAGVLPTSVTLQDLTEAIRRALAGERPVFAERLALFTEAVEQGSLQSREHRERVMGLTRRQLQILSMLSVGHSYKDVAKELGITPGTVRVHLQKILKKTGAGTKLEAIAMARAVGLIR